jgi:hypothetical protein
MGESCALKAHVRNSKGEVVESKLFNDLLHYTSNNRELTKEYYKVGTAEEFLSKVRDREDFETDENGEITFKSLSKIAKIDLNTDKLVETLNKDIHSGKYSYEDALKKVQYFNENNVLSDKVMATMVPVSNNQYFVSVIPISKTTTNENGREDRQAVNTDERRKLYETVRNREMEKRILSLLESHKVSVKFIEGETEGGRYSTENIGNAEKGLYGLIEVVETGNITDSLAEEAGHFAVGALGDYPLVKRLEKLLENEDVRREALGSDDYDFASLGTNPKREVAGRLVGKALQRKLSTNSVLSTLANRIANLAKRIFYNFTGNEMRWAAAKAESVANKIAYDFVDGSDRFSIENALSISETMYNASLTINTKTYRSVMDELGRLAKKLEAIADDSLTKQIGASLNISIVSGSDSAGKNALQYANEHVEAIADSLAFDGIVQAINQIYDYLGGGAQIDRLMQAVDMTNPSDFYANMARNGRYLRQARTLLKSAGIIVNVVSEALDKNNIDGVLKSSGESLEDSRYQDERGNWHSLDLKKTLLGCQTLLAGKESALVALEQSYFARFCEDIYGKKYISRATGLLWKDIWNGVDGSKEEEILYISNLVKGEGMADIDIFHRYLGSMSNNPDIIGQIVDKCVKLANKNADDIALQYKRKLSILKDRAKAIGLNVEDLIERDEDGLPTGNMIMPPAWASENSSSEELAIQQAYLDDLGDGADLSDLYSVDHGKWERDRAEFKKKAWEDFKKDYPDWESMTGFLRGIQWQRYLRRPAHSYKEWNKAHSIKVVVKNEDGSTKYVKWVPNKLYQTDAWEKLEDKVREANKDNKNYSIRNNAVGLLREWVGDYLKIKAELDAFLPEGSTQLHRLPQFKGTLGNSIRNAARLETGHFKNTKARLKTSWRRVCVESFIETADEEDFGSMNTMNSPDEELLGTKLDYETERASRLPIFGINKLKNMKDLSTDIIGSMAAYASMASTYRNLSDVIDALEVGKSALYARKLKGRDNSNSRKKKGVFSETPVSTDYEEKDKGSKNRAYGRYLKFLDKQVYGISAPYYGLTIWQGKRILLNKLVQNLSSLGGTMFLKGNVQGGMVNTLTGFNNIAKEAAAGEYFTGKDLYWAHKYYYKSFMSMWMPGCIPGRDLGTIHFSGGDLGNLVKSNRLDLFLEQMNALSNNRENLRNWHTNRNGLNNFYRMLGYLPYSAGDHYMQAMSYLAVAHGTNLYDALGDKEDNLWDAWEKVENADDMNKYSYGYSLKFKKMCPLGDAEITTDSLSKGFYLKEVEKTKENFHTWLYYQDSQWADKGYLSQNIDEYDRLRVQFRDSSTEELMKYQADRMSTLRDILYKVETFLSSPIMPAPQFTDKEQKYLDANHIGNGDYKNILGKVRSDIFNTIWTKADESAYMDRCREINNRLHGIYNEQDKTAWHNSIYTNAFLAMKGWALGNIEYIFSTNHYSGALGKNVEGFFNTALKVSASTLLGILYHTPNHMGFIDTAISMLNPWSNRSKKAMQKAGFTETQNFNARRMAASVYLMVMLYLLTLVTAPPDKDDDEEQELNMFQGNIYYLAYRTLLEQRAFLEPIELYNQSGSLMDFVPVGVGALMDSAKLVYEGIGAMLTDEDSSFYYKTNDTNGRYEEGDSKAKIHFIRLVPYLKSWWALNHPAAAKDNYDFGRKLRTR